MAWSASKVFRQFLADKVTSTNTIDLDSGSFKAALYNNSITPDQNVTAALSAYNASSSQWVTANEVYEATQWSQGGVALAGLAVNAGTAGVVFWDANDVVSGTAADLTNATGCLVYESVITTPVANPGVCYNYFGGPNSVVNGTFTIIWNTLGIWRATL
jgi:hypothetical protein